MITLLVVVIALALIFDFINGFHDAANSIATVVSTKVLTPFQAVLWAAVFNFVAFFIFKDHGVANTIAKTVVQDYITLPVIFAGLVAAIIWNLLTWWFGIPSSSSHTLIGGFAGAAIAHAGFDAVNSEPVLKTVSFIFLAPLVGMIMAFIISIWFLHSFRKGWTPKLISFSVIIIVMISLVNALEFKKDFNGGHSFTYQFTEKVKKDDLKAALTFKAEDGKEFVPVIKPGLDSSGNEDKSGTVYVVRTDYMKSTADGAGAVNQAVSDSLSNRIGSKVSKPFVIADAHAITASSPDKERYDTSNLKNNFETYWLKVVFHGKNFKWILMALILIIMAVFTIWLSSLNSSKANTWFKRLQLVSSAAFSIGHGGNDAQKVMGIITAALIASGSITEFKEMPVWVPLACYAAIAAGTMSGGWKIVKTMGTKITKVTPFEGVAAETAGAVTLFLTESLKIPVSTTHTITGSIIGVGATKRLSAVRWGVTLNLVWAWILTIPVSALMGGILLKLCLLFGLS